MKKNCARNTNFILYDIGLADHKCCIYIHNLIFLSRSIVKERRKNKLDISREA